MASDMSAPTMVSLVARGTYVVYMTFHRICYNLSQYRPCAMTSLHVT